MLTDLAQLRVAVCEGAVGAELALASLLEILAQLGLVDVSLSRIVPSAGF